MAKKPLFAKIAPKIEAGLNSKVGRGVQKGLDTAGTVCQIGGGLLLLAGLIVGANKRSQAKIDKAREIEMAYPKD